jgi:anti-sigma regulatory factor (Ser/Thr protein kinase)
MEPVEIQIPPRPEYVGVLRLALGSLARTAGMDEESIDDLRIAISEACTNAVVAQEESGAEDPVTLTWYGGEAEVAVEIAGPGRSQTDQDDVDTQGFATRLAMSDALLTSLVDGYEITEQGGRVRLTMSLEGRRAES